MKILDNIGLGLFLFSIVSIVFWSPRPFSISYGLDDAIDKISKKGHSFVEKAKSIPSKTDFAIKDTIGRMKVDIEDSKDLYRNSLTQTNEEIVKPTLNKISNWIGVDQDPLITKENLNKPKEKVCEGKTANKEIGKGDLDASYRTSNDLEDTTYNQNTELYKQTTTTDDQLNDWIPNHAHKGFDKSNLVATSTIDKVDDWVANNTHEVFDKSGLVATGVENEVDKIMDTTFQEMDMKKNLKFPNNSVSNIVGYLKEPFCHEDLNESNTLHNNLQLLGIHNKQDDVENITNIVYNNVRLLGVDNSNDFIIEDAHKSSQELDKQWDQFDIGLNLVEQSFTGMNNLGSTFVEDAKINKVKNELNSLEELHNSWSDQESIYDQNENSDENTRKHHQGISAHQYKHFQGDYDDDTNYGGVKEQMVKYSHVTYESPEVGANVDYKAGKHLQRAGNHANFNYEDARHKTTEFYKPIKERTRNFGRYNQYNEDDEDDDDENDDDEDFYEDF